MIEAKLQKFSYVARTARSVQLVGDFTNWEEHPIPLRRVPNGAWHAAIRLEPGTHYYRFLVDGQWHNDPESPLNVPNPFGGLNSVRQVN
jgi:1,4-alpha-glucan branching enzyme